MDNLNRQIAILFWALCPFANCQSALQNGRKLANHDSSKSQKANSDRHSRI